MSNVLVYRNELLPASETFIAAQAGALRRYRPWFAGLKRTPNGIGLSEKRMTLATDSDSLPSKVARRIFLRTGFAPAFHRKLRGLQPSLVHAHFAVDGGMALSLQKTLKVPLIVTLHGYDVTSDDKALMTTPTGRVYIARREELWQQATLFVCVSEYIRQRALERGFPKDKLWVHRIGIDLRSFEPNLSRDREPVVLFVGRLVEKKGCIHLIRAMAQVEARLPGTRLVVIGDGPLRAALEVEARARLRDFTFLGAQPASEVCNWMQRAQMLVAPSIVAKSGDAEGLGMVLCEAQAMQLPVVAFRGPAFREAVVDGESALLVDSSSDAALGAAILRLLKDKLLQARLGWAGRRHAEVYFDLRWQTTLLEDKYDEVLRGR